LEKEDEIPSQTSGHGLEEMCENLLPVPGLVKGREIWKQPKLHHKERMA